MERRPPFHLDRLVLMIGQYENRAVIRRAVSPPALPFLFPPIAANRPEHVASHDRRAEVLLPRVGAIVVETGFATRLASHRLERLRARKPVVQFLTAF